jgi:hypothetical protein
MSFAAASEPVGGKSKLDVAVSNFLLSSKAN